MVCRQYSGRFLNGQADAPVHPAQRAIHVQKAKVQPGRQSAHYVRHSSRDFRVVDHQRKDASLYLGQGAIPLLTQDPFTLP